MTGSDLPVLLVIVPLLAAPLCLVLRHGSAAWAVALASSWYCLHAAYTLLGAVRAGGTLDYALGGWPAPWGIAYRIDLLNAYVLLLVAAIAAVVVLYARVSAAVEIPRHQHARFYAALLLCLAGMLGITITGDAFNLFVFLEISSLSSYALISLGRDRRALTASYQYLIMGTLGATFILIGVGLLYMLTGTLNMVDIAGRIQGLAGNRTLLAAFAFLVAGIGLKLALFPLHLWLPNAYAYAPSVVTALLAGTATKVAVYVLLRFLYTVFGYDLAFGDGFLHYLLAALAVVGLLVASTVAIFQDDVKRMLAYSSVAQIGYTVLGISLLNQTGLTAALVHLFNHALMKTALFLALGCVLYRLGSMHLDDLRGLGRQMPWTLAAFVAGGLSLIGVPLTVGFISKWYLVLAALELGWWPVAVVVLGGSLLSVIYIGRVVEVAYMQPRPAAAERVREAPLGLLLPTWALVAASFWFGIDTSLTLGTAGEIAGQLFGGGR
jgi:multicomponent Na+:H+ antiporter subunit D